MPHSIVAGMTGCGKSTLAKLVISDSRALGRKVMLLDPLADPSYEADYTTKDSAEFLRRVFDAETKSCLVVVDESSAAIGRYNPEMEKLATMARHHGHQTLFIMQQMVQTGTAIRNNAETLILFKTGRQAARMLAEEFANEAALLAPTMDKGEYLVIPRFGATLRGNVFNELKRRGLWRK